MSEAERAQLEKHLSPMSSRAQVIAIIKVQKAGRRCALAASMLGSRDRQVPGAHWAAGTPSKLQAPERPCVTSKGYGPEE